MIKGLIETSNGKLVLLGLSHNNLDELRKGNPIYLDSKQTEELGIEGALLIMAGETEQLLANDLTARFKIRDGVGDERPPCSCAEPDPIEVNWEQGVYGCMRCGMPIAS